LGIVRQRLGLNAHSGNGENIYGRNLTET
jgi:hypothetical protein